LTTRKGGPFFVYSQHFAGLYHNPMDLTESLLGQIRSFGWESERCDGATIAELRREADACFWSRRLSHLIAANRQLSDGFAQAVIDLVECSPSKGDCQ
jgi:transketolase N-terminal domain/subunit